MRRALIRASGLCSLFLFAIALAAPGARGQATSLPSKKEATALLQKALEGMKLFEPGAPSFHLVARVHYELAGQASDGMYELLWAAPDRYRENFKMGDHGEVDLALGDKMYTFRSTTALMLPLSDIRKVLVSPLRGYFDKQSKAGRVFSAQVGGKSQICVDASSVFEVKKEVCFDPATNRPVSASVRFEGVVLGDEGFRAEHFLPLGDKFLPGHFSHRDLKQAMDFSVDIFEKAQEFDAAIFTPPPNVVVRDWCPSPDVKGEDPDLVRAIYHERGKPIVFAYYILIDGQGRVHEFTPLIPNVPNVDKGTASWFHDARFPKYSCNGKPIEYERIYYPFIFTVTTHVYVH